MSRDIERLKQIVKDVKDGADKKDPVAVALSAKKEQKDSGDLLDKVKGIAASIPSHQYKKDLLDAGDQLEKAVPYQLAAAKRALENPNDAEAKREVAETTQKVLDALDNLEAVSRQPDLATNNERLKGAAQDVLGGVKSGDRHAAINAARKAADLGTIFISGFSNIFGSHDFVQTTPSKSLSLVMELFFFKPMSAKRMILIVDCRKQDEATGRLHRQQEYPPRREKEHRREGKRIEEGHRCFRSCCQPRT